MTASHSHPHRPSLRWMPLDNAAKIYPAARSQKWSNVFRLSATLTDTVDREVLQSALETILPRFPSICARLRRGIFWYYIQQIPIAPELREESSYPLTRMNKAETRRCAFRVLIYRRRIAVEFFHSLTDGNGGLIFLKTLVAQYLREKYGVDIPSTQGVLDPFQPPAAAELEDSFPKFAGGAAAARDKTDAWRLSGTPESDGYQHLTCMELPTDRVAEKAREYGVSVTTFLSAAMMMALQNLQKLQVPNPHRRKAIKVLIPVNLRKIFPSSTLRNFVLYTTPEIDPRLGEFSFPEICNAVRHRMGLEVNAKFMSSLIETNVRNERRMALKLMPLFVKNIAMKMVFQAVGERKSCLSLSNLGRITLPEAMLPYVVRMDFILGVQATAPYNCGILSYGNQLNINIIRNIQEPALEYHLYCVLRDMGLPVQVRSNHR